MLGPYLLIAPVLDPGQNEVKVYIPKLENNRRWFNSITMKPASKAFGWVTCEAPLGHPVCFVDEMALNEATLAPFLKIMSSYIGKN
jgi:alpha-glucosidase (family GH31 glycosyl hydrolase)